MKKATIYARVSTRKQENEHSILSQVAEVKELIEQDGGKLIKEYRDDGWSGAILERPALDELMLDAKNGLFEKVYVYDTSRFARKVVHQMIILDKLKRLGIEVKFKDNSKNNTPQDRFALQVKAAADEYRREEILYNTHRGRLYKAKNGMLVGANAPYGFKYIHKTKERNGYYEIVSQEAEVVKRVFDLYIKYQSLGAVMRHLNERKIPIHFQDTWKSRGKKKIWHQSLVSRILRRTDYMGVAYYGKSVCCEPEKKTKKYTKQVKTARRLRDKSEWLPIKVPQIVDREKFDYVQQLLDKNSRPYGLRKYFSLLGGLGILECGDCGGHIYSEVMKKCRRRIRTYYYYRCRNCDHCIPIDTINKPVWDLVKKALENPKVLKERLNHLREKDSVKTSETLKQKKKELLNEKEKIKNSQDNLLGLFAEEQMSKERLLKKVGEYKEQEKGIDKLLNDIERETKQLAKKNVIIKNLKEFCKLNKAQLQGLTKEKKRELLRFLLEKVIYSAKNNTLNVSGYVPLEINEKTEKLIPMSIWDYSLQPK